MLGLHTAHPPRYHRSDRNGDRVTDFSNDQILFERRGAAGFVTLNRPQALNAVTHGMVHALRAQLDAARGARLRWSTAGGAITR